LFRFSWQHYRSHLGGIVAAGVSAAVGALAEGISLVLLVALAERAANRGDGVLAELGPFTLDYSTGVLLLGTVGLVLVGMTFRVIAVWLQARTVISWERREEVRAVRALLDTEYEHMASLSPAELQGVVSHVRYASEGLNSTIKVINAAISFLMLAALALVTSPVTALAMAAVGAVLLAALRPLTRLSRRSGKVASQLEVEAGRMVHDAARGGREIRLYGVQARVLDEFRGVATSHAKAKRHLRLIRGLAPVAYQGLGLLFVVLALAFVLNVGTFDATALGAVALLFLRSLSYGQRASDAQQTFVQMIAYAGTLDDELDALTTARENFGDEPLGRVESIALQYTSYRYPENPSTDDTLIEIDLELRAPGVVGLVGPSGSGKSTLAQLLLRLRRPTKGTILVNEQDIDSYSRDTWTREVALVPQQPQLIRGSVRDNIAFFRERIADDDVERVSIAVGLHDLFESLPQGYDTELGETNRELSIGQLQRLGIARALVGDPSFLVLDEPTSALDAESEAWVQRAIHDISQRALLVIITHRATTLEVCDRVVRLGDGRVLDVATKPAGTSHAALEPEAS